MRSEFSKCWSILESFNTSVVKKMATYCRYLWNTCPGFVNRIWLHLIKYDITALCMLFCYTLKIYLSFDMSWQCWTSQRAKFLFKHIGTCLRCLWTSYNGSEFFIVRVLLKIKYSLMVHWPRFLQDATRDKFWKDYTIYMECV